MIPARLKLTLVFTAAMVVTGAALAVVVSASRTAGAYSAIGREALADADVRVRIISQSAKLRDPTVVRNSSHLESIPSRLAEQRETVLKSYHTQQVQSIMFCTKSSFLINNTLYRDRQIVKGFTIDKISSDTVTVKQDAWRFDLKMAK